MRKVAPFLGVGPGGLYPLLDDSVLTAAQMPKVAAVLAKAGIGILQLRLKRWSDDTRLSVQRAVANSVSAVTETSVALMVDDRADLARILAVEAPDRIIPGLHIGQRDLPPTVARQIVGPNVLIGHSTHNVAQVLAAQDEPVDHLGFGPIFTTGSKAGADPTVGLIALRDAAAQSAIPIVAIGGMNRERAGEAMAAGAQAVAMIAALYQGLDLATDAGLRTLGERAGAWTRWLTTQASGSGPS